MKKLKYLFVLAIMLLQSCNGQKMSEQEFFDKNFNWTIRIPQDFENVTKEDWTKLQNKGADAIEKTMNTEVINQSETIFVFKNDQFNYFEANFQPFDEAVDGDYLENIKNVNAVLFETFETQMPNTKIDSTTSVELIDNLEFHKLKVKIEYPNKIVLNVEMYSRLFNKKEFTVNMMYVDIAKGRAMKESWKNSKFTK